MSDPIAAPSTPPDPALVQHVFQLGAGYIVSAVLYVAVKLDVAEQLASGPKSCAQLAPMVGANEDAVYRVLRALAMVGLFSEISPRTFTLTPAGTLLRAGVPGSLRDMLLWLPDAFHFRVYAETLYSVQTGQTAGDRVVGMPVFDYLAREPELSRTFNNAMTAFSAGMAPAVLEAYDFSDVRVLVDVAGGHGMLLAAILRQYPAMRGILFDQEHVIAGARLDAFGVGGRCETRSGDFFAAVPSGGDAYLMKHIIHDWDDDRARRILERVRIALDGRRDGKLILVEAVIQPGDRSDLMKLIDVEMLLLPGGRERNAQEFEALFARAGFTLTRIVPTQGMLSVIEGRLA